MYEFEIDAIYGSPTGVGTPDFKYGVGEDTTKRGTFGVLSEFGTTDAVSSPQAFTDQGSSTALTAGTAAADRMIQMRGWFLGNGGTWRLLWSQNTSNAAPTYVRVGSVLRYREIV